MHITTPSSWFPGGGGGSKFKMSIFVDLGEVEKFVHMFHNKKLLSKPNVTQLNSTQSNYKSNFVGLDTVATWNPPYHPQTFQSLLDQLES